MIRKNARNLHLFSSTFVKLLQGTQQLGLNGRRGGLGPSTPSSMIVVIIVASSTGLDVVGMMIGGRAEVGGLQTLGAVEIIDLALTGITQDVIGLGDEFKLGFGLLIGGGILVGMPLHGESFVRLLQVIFSSAAAHFQYVIIIHSHSIRPCRCRCESEFNHEMYKRETETE